MKATLAPTPPDLRLRRVPWSRTCLLPRRRWLLLAACAGSILIAGALSGPARAESPESVAKAWAEDLRVSLRSSYLRTKTGTGLGLRPLDPQAFAMLNGRQRRQVYEWLLNALGRTMLDSYHLAGQARLTALARELEDKGDPNWLDDYLEILRNDSTRISIECTGMPGETTIGLSCSARDIQRDGASLGRATASFRLDWLNRPIALDLAVGSIAGAVVGRMKEPGVLGRPRIVDHRTGDESLLSTHVAGALEVAVDEQMRTSRALRPVGAGESESEYRLEGQVRALDETRLELFVSVHLGDRRLHSVSETISCASIPPSFPCAMDPDPPPPPPDPTRIVLPDGFTLADWVLIAAARGIKLARPELRPVSRGRRRSGAGDHGADSGHPDNESGRCAAGTGTDRGGRSRGGEEATGAVAPQGKGPPPARQLLRAGGGSRGMAPSGSSAPGAPRTPERVARPPRSPPRSSRL